MEAKTKGKNKQVIKQIISEKSTLGVDTFPPPERLSNEKTREAYSKLYYAYNDIHDDREDILETLRKEMIKNEEQRNYIEMLKQTLESTLVKNGLFTFVEKQKQILNKGGGYTHNYNNSPLETIIDVVRLKKESDKYLSDLNQNEELIKDLKDEIFSLRETNQEMNKKKEKIKESLENGIKELEEAKERLQALELEKDYLADELSELKEYNDKILKDYELTLERSSQQEKEIEEYRLQFEDQQVLENKLIEYKNNFEKISNDLENLFNQKTNLEEEISSLRNQVCEKDNEVKKLQQEKENTNAKFSHLEGDLITFKKSNEKFKNKNEELTNNLNDSLKLLSETERNLEDFKSQHEKIVKEREDFLLQLEDFERKNIILIQEKESLSSDISILKHENLEISLENDKYRIESKEFSSNFNKILSQYESLNINYKNLESMYNSQKMEKENLQKEISQSKEKLINDDFMRTREINKNLSQINTIKAEKMEMENLLNAEIFKFKEEVNKTIIDRNESELKMKREYNMIKNKYEEVADRYKYLEVNLLEKEKYISSLEEDMSRRTKMDNSNALESYLQEIKIALHSCLSSASFYMQKNDAIYSRELENSLNNLNINKNQISFVDCLKSLEDWLAKICKQLEYSPLNTKEMTVHNQDNQSLSSTNEKTMKELKSYKNDNKKLYDHNKKLLEESHKYSLLNKEIKFMESILNKVLKMLPNREIAQLFVEMMNNSSMTTMLENEKIKNVLKKNEIEKFCLKNNTDPLIEEDYQKLICNLDKLNLKISEKKENLINLENQLSLLNESKPVRKENEKVNKETSGLNVFKGNMFDKNLLNVEKDKDSHNLDFDSRKFYRNSEIKKNSNRDNRDQENMSRNSYIKESDSCVTERKNNLNEYPHSSSYYKRVFDLDHDEAQTNSQSFGMK
jgi:chromosome segregation ATPase